LRRHKGANLSPRFYSTGLKTRKAAHTKRKSWGRLNEAGGIVLTGVSVNGISFYFVIPKSDPIIKTNRTEIL